MNTTERGGTPASTALPEGWQLLLLYAVGCSRLSNATDTSKADHADEERTRRITKRALSLHRFLEGTAVVVYTCYSARTAVVGPMNPAGTQ